MNLLILNKRKRQAIRTHVLTRSKLPSWIYWPQNYAKHIWTFVKEHATGGGGGEVGRQFPWLGRLAIFAVTLQLAVFVMDPSWDRVGRTAKHMLPGILMLAIVAFFSAPPTKRSTRQESETRKITNKEFAVVLFFGVILYAVAYKLSHFLVG